MAGATEVARATVTIIPNMKGSQEKITRDLEAGVSDAGESAGKGLGLSMVDAIKGTVAVAAIGKFIGDSLKAGADLQQSLGGIETLFKDNADVVKGYASEAYRTAGISANDYMENVTSFSAALIKSMDGDTAAAAEMANTAMIDMADNANKMGTDMSSIQAAYQGFAKGQYQLLDNLKLGYGGTKTEMERLLADATKLSGVEYNIDNLGDVYEAIHVIQEDLGITGTTAREAAETFSGSFASMKAAATDLMGNLALGNDIGPQIQALGDTVTTFVVGNVLPMVSNIVQQIPTIIGQLPSFLASIIPQIIPMAGQMISGLAQGIITNLPVFAQGMASLVQSAGEVILNTDWTAVGQTVVSMIDAGFHELINASAEIWSSVGEVFMQVIEASPILTDAWNAVTSTATSIWDTVSSAFMSVISASPILTEAWDTLTEVAQTIWDTVTGLFTGEITLSEVATGVWNTLSETATTIWETVTGIFTGQISVVGILTGAWDIITTTASTLWTSVTDYFTTQISVVEILTSLWNSITETASNLWNTVTTTFTQSISVSGILTGAWDVITTTASNLWATVTTTFTGSISVTGILTGAWDTLISTAKTLWGSAKAVFEASAPAVKEVATAAWNKLSGAAKRFFNAAKAVFQGAAPAVKAVTCTAWSTIADTAGKLFDAAKAKFETVAPAVKAVVTKAWDSLQTTASTIWGEVKNIFGSIDIEWPDFGELASSAFEGLKTAAKNAWDWIKGLFGGGASDETVEAVHGSTAEMEAALANCNLVVSDVDLSSIETANSDVETVVDHWGILFDGMSLATPTVDTSTVSMAQTAVETAAGNMQSAMNFSWSLPALHGSLPSISVSMNTATSSDGKTSVSYPVFNVGTKWFAKGGIFEQPTIIGVGEKGAEAALPLDTFWRRLSSEFDRRESSGATINNYIEVNGATDPVQYADELARELQLQLKRA